MIKIYTLSHKKPEFIEMQLKSFKRNLKDEFEFIIFNNANFDIDKSNYNEINRICAENSLKCVPIQKDQELISKLRSYNNEHIFNGQGMYFNSVIACAYPMCYTWKHIFSKSNDKICIIDSDMFVVSFESFEEALEKADLLYLEQSRGDGSIFYMWNGLVLADLSKLPNKEEVDWWCGYCENFCVDVGGHTFYYLKKYRDQIKIKGLLQHYVGEDSSCDFTPANYEFYTLGGENKSIWHMRSGSLWDTSKTKEYYDKKISWFKRKFDL